MYSPVRLIAIMCAVEVVGMLGVSTFPALLPEFIELWQLSNTEAGWINAIFFAGYMVFVPILVSLTDRIDPRRIYLICMALNAISLAGFGLLAYGFWSAMVLKFLGGVGLAGTYMPGLKALSDHIEGAARSRAVSFYTASFGVGMSLSFYLSSVAAEAAGWRWTFGLAGIGSVLALGIAWRVLPPKADSGPAPTSGRLFDFMPVLRNRNSMAYTLAYAFHNFELFGLRSWIVLFLTYSLQFQPAGTAFAKPATIAALVTLVALPASVTGNELAIKTGRRRVVVLVMLASAVMAWVLGFSVQLPYGVLVALCFVYAVTIAMDSSPITAGAIQEASPHLTGTTMAVHSGIGFFGAFLGPLVFGVILDLTGQGESPLSWGLAFGCLGVAVAMGPVCMALLYRRGYRPPEPAAESPG